MFRFGVIAKILSDISKFDLLVIQIDGLHVAEDVVLIGAIGADAIRAPPHSPISPSCIRPECS